MGALLVVVLATLVGCAQKQITREEYMALKAINDQERVRVYAVDRETVLAAAEIVLSSSDNDYMPMRHDDNSLTMHRRWFQYLVFAAGYGEDFWKISTEERDGTTVVTATAWPGQTAGGIIPVPLGTAGSEEVHYISPPIYRLFFSRMDYVLGLSGQWVDCSTAKKTMNPEGLNDTLAPLCALVKSKVPEPIVHIRQASSVDQ